MTEKKRNTSAVEWKTIMEGQKDYLKPLVQEVVQQVLEAEMLEAVEAERYERTGGRKSYRSGYYHRRLIARVGRLELRVPQDREGRFSTELFGRYQRSEQALVSALAEMYVQGVSTRKVKAVTEELCGHKFSASTVSEINKGLDGKLAAFVSRRLEEPYPYLIMDARYEKVREAGVIRSRAVMIAIGITLILHRISLPQMRGAKGAGLLRRSKASWLRRLDCIIRHWRKVLRNEADVAKSCDLFFANKSSFRAICN